ncbi:MAG: glycosyltransferase family 9 protein [Bryobacteraceae bacterium]|nr:glycosyltransferase family 9 protein [Bryobacteraceae bacterium]
MRRLLVVRLGAMGDILHAMPGAASLRAGGGVFISWAVKPQFRELLEGGGVADEILEIRRKGPRELLAAVRSLRLRRFDAAIDFQGLLQSAILARVSGARRVWGFERHLLREPAAALFYDERVVTEAAHVVDRNLDLALAAGAAARVVQFPLPEGRAEGELPQGAFVLASPFAGWGAKQWPLGHYFELAALLEREAGLPLVFNVSPAQAGTLSQQGARVHVSSIAGLIDATRRAAAVVGVDSGPLHLAAALDRPGVAIYGPTDPARNGPYSQRIRVLRSPDARTSYARGTEPDASMRAVTPRQVLEALREVL